MVLFIYAVQRGSNFPIIEHFHVALFVFRLSTNRSSGCFSSVVYLKTGQCKTPTIDCRAGVKYILQTF